MDAFANYSADEMARRLNTLHPIARRQLAAMTDSTYRRHAIYKPTLWEQVSPFLPSWWVPVPPLVLAALLGLFS